VANGAVISSPEDSDNDDVNNDANNDDIDNGDDEDTNTESDADDDDEQEEVSEDEDEEGDEEDDEEDDDDDIEEVEPVNNSGYSGGVGNGRVPVSNAHPFMRSANAQSNSVLEGGPTYAWRPPQPPASEFNC
jgi:hypothetical protein